MDKLQKQLSISKKSLQIEDDRVSNIILNSEGDSEYMLDKNSPESKKTEESYMIKDEEDLSKKKLYFSPSVPTKVNSSNNLYKTQKTFLVRNQEEALQNLSDIKTTIEKTIKKYSEKIQNEILEFNDNYCKNYE
eukprot:jgi/Orpsp1_1/1192368/evm.model.d7180000092673.1